MKNRGICASVLRRQLMHGSAIALAAAVTGAPVMAQQTGGAAEMEEVVVTGSYIRGTAENAALPVEVFTAEDLKKRGTPSTVEFIKSLAVTGPVLGDSNQFVTAAQNRIGGGTMNLRGLGPERTLVLLNGKRLQYGAVDTNMLPIGAIGRVEILKDGAAATYGSDAIGGVANFITRRDLDGFDVSADYRLVDGSDGDYTGSAAYGWTGDKANFMIAAGYQHRSELSVMDRDWSYQPRTVNPTSYSLLGNPGTIYPWLTPSTVLDSNCGALGGDASYYSIYPICYLSYAPFLNLVEKEDRFQIYGEANVDLTDDVKLHIETLYAYNNTPALRSSPGYPPLSGPSGPGSFGVFSTPTTNPGAVTALEQAGFNAGQIAGIPAISLFAWRPYFTGGNPLVGGLGGASSKREYKLFRTSVGLEGKFGDTMNWSVSGTYVRDRAFARTPDVLTNRLQSALNGLGGPNCTGTTPGANSCEWFNPFSNGIAGNVALGLDNPGYVEANANSDELNAWLFDNILQRAVSDYYVMDAVVSGSTGISLGGGEIGFAIGGQYRHLSYAYDPLNDNSNALITPCPTPGVTTCAFRTGPFIFQGQTVPNRLKENVKAVFAELSLPITERLSAQAAIRYEDYGGLTGSTTNPKLSAKWQALDMLAFRGSVGTTFRGPTPGNRQLGGNTGLTGITAAGNAFKAVDFYGNPEVGPEKAFTYSLGAIVEAGGLQFTADYWNFKLKDQIATVPANVIATGAVGAGGFIDCSGALRELITFNNNDTCTQGVTTAFDITRIRSDTTNGPTVRTSGLDLSLDYRVDDVAGGTLGFNATTSIVLKYEQDAFIYEGIQVSAAYDAKGYTNYDRLPGTVSEWRGSFYVDYAKDDHYARLTFNYIDGATDNRGPTAIQTGPNPLGCTVATASASGCQLITFGQEVEAFKTFDFTYSVQLPWDTTATLTVNNILDTDPPKARLELSYDPFIGNPYGRTFKLGLRKTF